MHFLKIRVCNIELIIREFEVDVYLTTSYRSDINREKYGAGKVFGWIGAQEVKDWATKLEIIPTSSHRIKTKFDRSRTKSVV